MGSSPLELLGGLTTTGGYTPETKTEDASDANQPFNFQSVMEASGKASSTGALKASDLAKAGQVGLAGDSGAFFATEEAANPAGTDPTLPTEEELAEERKRSLDTVEKAKKALEEAQSPAERDDIIKSLDPSILSQLILLQNSAGRIDFALLKRAASLLEPDQFRGLMGNLGINVGGDGNAASINNQLKLPGDELLLTKDVAQDKMLADFKSQLLSTLNATQQSQVDLRSVQQFVEKNITNEQFKTSFSNQQTADTRSSIQHLNQLMNNTNSLNLPTTKVVAPTIPMGNMGNNNQFSQMVGANILWMASKNIQSAQMRIDPGDIGGVLDVKVSIEGDIAKISFIAPNMPIQNVLVEHFNTLQDMMQQFGLKLSQDDVSYQQQPPQQSFHEASLAANLNHENDSELAQESQGLRQMTEVTSMGLGLIDDYA